MPDPASLRNIWHPTTMGAATLAGLPLYGGALRYLDPHREDDEAQRSGLERFGKGFMQALPAGLIAAPLVAGGAAMGAGARAVPEPEPGLGALQHAAQTVRGAASGAGAGLGTYAKSLAGGPGAKEQMDAMMRTAYPHVGG